MKKFNFILFILIFILSAKVFAEDRVGVVGNSLASNFSYWNQIDWDLPDTDKHCPWVTRHAVGGDGWVSTGVPEDTEFWNFGFCPKGYGKGYVTNFIKESKEYDWCILINGSNEISWIGLYTNKATASDIVKDYIYKVDNYLSQLFNVNPDIKVIFYLIPEVHNEQYHSKEHRDNLNKAIKVWNEATVQLLEEKYPNIFIEEFIRPYEYLDRLHYSQGYNIAEWERLQDKYKIKLAKKEK